MNHGSGPNPHGRLGRSGVRLDFARASVFDGVARREVGTFDLVAHSVAVVVPSLTALGSGLAFPDLVGPGFWISALLGYALVWLFASTFAQFASRLRSPGSLYTFAAQGLGASTAFLVGAALIVGYSAMTGFGLANAAGRFDAAVVAAGFARPESPWWSGALLLVCAALCFHGLARGIGWSSRAVLVAEVASLALLVVVLVTWSARYGWPRSEMFSLHGASPGRILAGAALIVVLTLAFESSISLGAESKRPFRDVPLALHSSLVLAGALFLVASVVSSARPDGSPSIWDWRWFAPGRAVSGWDAAALVILGVSLLALAMCVWSALARLLFAMAREGVLPAAFGRTDRRGIPMRAVVTVAPLAMAAPVAAALHGSDVWGFSWELKESAAVVICVAYAVVALCLPFFLRRIDELTWGPVAVALVAAGGAAAVAVDQMVKEWSVGSWLGTGLLTLVVVLAAALDLRWRRRGDLRPVGRHDETLWDQVLRPLATGGGDDAAV